MGMEFRPFYLAQVWAKLGHSVTIVAGDYSHLRQNNPEIQQDLQQTDESGIRYIWFKTGT
jgi:pyruvate/2-oxoglutarate dehydrogenase complex dihydrolipoamide dehydrogenase (E3) component